MSFGQTARGYYRVSLCGSSSSRNPENEVAVTCSASFFVWGNRPERKFVSRNSGVARCLRGSFQHLNGARAGLGSRG